MHPGHDDCLELLHRPLEPGCLVPPCTLGTERGAVVPFNILNVHLDLDPFFFFFFFLGYRGVAHPPSDDADTE